MLARFDKALMGGIFFTQKKRRKMFLGNRQFHCFHASRISIFLIAIKF